ncbi:MAG: hypothetical protein PHI56_03575 [Victivallaceae bacterium]|nr:hypothetical protein [Victivallaceae bacterium]MDD3703063.1 hypothetical protein [Victivallaceae bacterium]MDD5663314.1 hypothetical protein [Victivallaceae bacterium]
MKSAFELALERSGGALDEISEQQKQAINEIDIKCKAKLAEIDIAYSSKKKRTSDPAELEQINNDMMVERASILDKAEREKNTIRKK